MTITATYPGVKSEIISILRESDRPVDLHTAQYIENLRALLAKALDCVDADEEARHESWPGEVESGELILDLRPHPRGTGMTFPQAMSRRSICGRRQTAT